MNKGFSLTEAAVAIAIVGILITLGYSRFNHYIARTRQAEAKNNLNLIVSLQEAYLLEHKQYSFLFPVGLDNSGKNSDGSNKYHCGTSNPGSGMLNELGFRPPNCNKLRYQYWMPSHVKKAVTGHDPARALLTPPQPVRFSPRYIVRADSKPTNTDVHIWPDCDSRDMWRVSRTAGESNYTITQPVDGEFNNTGGQRRALENCND